MLRGDQLILDRPLLLRPDPDDLRHGGDSRLRLSVRARSVAHVVARAGDVPHDPAVLRGDRVEVVELFEDVAEALRLHEDVERRQLPPS